MMNSCRVLLAVLGGASIMAAACSSFSGSDVSSGVDAGTDAGQVVNVPFCKGQDAGYCADFDNDALPFGTMKGAPTAGATLTSSSKDFVSAPHSLLAHAPVAVDDGGNQTEQAVVIADGIVIGKGRRIEADIKPTGTGSGTIMQLYPVDQGGGVPSGGFLVYAKSLDLAAYSKDGAPLARGTIFPSLGTAWIHVVVDLAVGPNGAMVTASATVNGQSGMTQTLTLPGSAATFRVVFGAQPNSTLGTAPFELELDNLVVR
jgi:hypothetical protein